MDTNSGSKWRPGRSPGLPGLERTVLNRTTIDGFKNKEFKLFGEKEIIPKKIARAQKRSV